ncbi:MAG: nicotinamide mononucleotide transporter [Clostridia bacterium]|nr:nicotinamide mononucleotide transporter [Clostridia bacterium]
MKKLKSLFLYFSKFELFLWIFSAVSIIVSFIAFDRESYITLIASLLGVTSLIFNAKGNPIGQALMILFSILYGFISYSFSYYGEMITYLGMTAPMALFALISWLKNPYNGNIAEVKTNRLKLKEIIFMFFLSAIVTVLFYFILKAFDTSSLILSAFSVTTSFVAVYLTFRRNPFFALAYASNDIILILLWSVATISNNSYISVVICFVIFLINDLYGFYNWLKTQRRQSIK